MSRPVKYNCYMSGHSKWSTIKRQKAANDNARGKVFSRLSRAIAVAVKTGGGPNIDSNYKLKVAVDAAKAENMPKDTIERAISKASSSAENVDEVTYEGFGPEGVNVIVEAATDNRNRTAQEIKNIFEKNGGSMGQPGSVSFNFEPRGYILVTKNNVEQQMLKLIDLGVEEMEEGDDGIEVYVNPQELYETKGKIEDAGYTVKRSELMQKPKLMIPIKNADKAKKLFALVEQFEDQDDVQSVFENADIPDEVASAIN